MLPIPWQFPFENRQSLVILHETSTVWSDTYNTLKSLIEPLSESVDAAFSGFRMDLVPNWDPFLLQENDEFMHKLYETDHDEHEQDNYEHNNEGDQYHNSDNLLGQVRDICKRCV